MSHDSVGIGLVGAGGFGRFCLEAFAAMPEVRIAAIADVDKALVKPLAERYGARPYSSIDSLLDDPAVQIVALNTPPFLHAQQGIASLKAGKHLFCEKPLVLTVDDGEKLLHRLSRTRFCSRSITGCGIIRSGRVLPESENQASWATCGIWI